MRRGRLRTMSKVRDIVDVVDCGRCRSLSDEHRVSSPTFVGDNYVIYDDVMRPAPSLHIRQAYSLFESVWTARHIYSVTFWMITNDLSFDIENSVFLYSTLLGPIFLFVRSLVIVILLVLVLSSLVEFNDSKLHIHRSKLLHVSLNSEK